LKIDRLTTALDAARAEIATLKVEIKKLLEETP
jgi:hypothetical protein